MYTYLLDETEGVAVARIQAGTTSKEMTHHAVQSIVALEGAAYRKPFPRVSLILIDDDSEHFGSTERDRLVRANAQVHNPTLRLMVARTALHAAAIGVIQQQVTDKSKVVQRQFRTMDEALASTASERPGLDRVVHRLLAVLDESTQSAVLKAAPPLSMFPGFHRSGRPSRF